MGCELGSRFFSQGPKPIDANVMRAIESERLANFRGLGLGAKVTSLGIAIISWPGFEDNAREIFSQVADQDGPVFVLHNGELQNQTSGSQSWIQFTSEAYFGSKFKWAIENIRADALLFIVADTWHEDWGSLVDSCHRAFSSEPNIAVWAPVIDETWWNAEKILVNTDMRDDGLQHVIAVDSIVWALSSQVVSEMKKLDYSGSQFGWGIEVACAAIARCQGKLVVRDTRLEVAHRRGTTYSTDVANEEGQEFYQQLDPTYKAMVAVIEEFALLKTVSTPRTVSRRIRRGWGYVRDLVYRLVVKRFFSGRK